MDSPLCYACLNQGLPAFTYHVIRTNFFKCGTCKNLYPKTKFVNEEFLWKDDTQAWLKVVKVKVNDERGKKYLARLVEEIPQMKAQRESKGLK